jgi:hypothetical protein
MESNQYRILTDKLNQLERERDNIVHQINIQEIESDYKLNSVRSIYCKSDSEFESQSRYATNIIKLNEKRYKLDSEIEAVIFQLLQEKSIFEEEQRKKEEEKFRIFTEQFINFTNTLSNQEIEEFQKRYEEDKKEQRYRKYKSLREKME